MFSESRNDQRRRISDRHRLRDRDNAAGFKSDRMLVHRVF